MLGALAGLGVVLGVGFGRVSWVGRGVGRAGRAGWVGRAVGRGVWPCLARWPGWAWCWAPGLAVLGALAGLGVVLGVGFGRAGRAGRVGRVSKYKSILWKYKSRLSKYKSILSKYKNTLSNYTKHIYKYVNIL